MLDAQSCEAGMHNRALHWATETPMCWSADVLQATLQGTGRMGL